MLRYASRQPPSRKPACCPGTYAHTLRRGFRFILLCCCRCWLCVFPRILAIRMLHRVGRLLACYHRLLLAWPRDTTCHNSGACLRRVQDLAAYCVAAGCGGASSGTAPSDGGGTRHVPSLRDAVMRYMSEARLAPHYCLGDMGPLVRGRIAEKGERN